MSARILPDPGNETPMTILDLFKSIGLKNSKPRYSWPWPGYLGQEDGGLGYKQARTRLSFYERNTKERYSWVPFNGNSSNDGPMSISAHPGNAFTERVTNAIDACVQRALLKHKGPMPTSPVQALEMLFGLSETHMDSSVPLVEIDHFTPSKKGDDKDNVLDCRDFGIGMTAEEMPHTILSLSRGNKRNNPALIGKHGQGASGTCQYSDLVVVASRKEGSAKIAYTIIDRVWPTKESKTPTYQYLVVDGKVPECDASAFDFPVGTLVRHIGYDTHLPNAFMENSVAGLLSRNLATCPLVIGVNYHYMRHSKEKKEESFPGRSGHRQAKGSVLKAREAHRKTLNTPADKRAADVSHHDVLHHFSEIIKLPKMDFGGREGEIEPGHVVLEGWVIKPKSPDKQLDAIRAFANPYHPIILTVDGQTHAEEARALLTGSPSQGGAGYWAVGRAMFIHLGCDGLDPRARYELFTSSREQLKNNRVKDYLLKELVHRLKMDERLRALQTEMATPVRSDKENEEEFSEIIKKHLKASGISLDSIWRESEKFTEPGLVPLQENQQQRKRNPRPTITVRDEPTFLEWWWPKGDRISVYPGQQCTFMFRTDAPVDFWDPANPILGKIMLINSILQYTGGAGWHGGYVSCRFQCPEDAQVGSNGIIQIQCETRAGSLLKSHFWVEVVEREEKSPSNPSNKSPNKTLGPGFVERERPKKDCLLRPIPVTPEEPLWGALGWTSPASAAFQITQDPGGLVRMYYNKEYPFLQAFLRKFHTKGQDLAYLDRYELMLAIHGIFHLNHQVQMDLEAEPFIKQLCATNDSLIQAAATEIDLQIKNGKLDD